MKRGRAVTKRLLGYLICIAAPGAAMVDQFGYLLRGGTVGFLEVLPCSCLGLFMMLLCFKPVFNWAKRQLRSDAAWKMWLIVAIIGGVGVLAGKAMFIIGCFGFGGNLIGHFMIRSAERSLEQLKGA